MTVTEFFALLGVLVLMSRCISILGATPDSVGIAQGVCALGLASLFCAGSIALLKRMQQ